MALSVLTCQMVLIPLQKMKVNSIIRKISIGSDYKNDAMLYSLNQQVYGGHEICNIIFDENEKSYVIFIQKEDEVLPWKKFNQNMSISVEYDLNY